jgi:hypothetical protein
MSSPIDIKILSEDYGSCNVVVDIYYSTLVVESAVSYSDDWLFGSDTDLFFISKDKGNGAFDTNASFTFESTDSYNQFGLGYGAYLNADTVGNIGIGTTSPEASFNLADNNKLLVNSGLDYAAALFGSTSDGIGIDGDEIIKMGGTLYLGTGDSNYLFLKTNGENRVTVTSSGDVGIGTRQPESELDVEGDIQADGVIVHNITVDTVSASMVYVDGNLGVGTTSPSATFHVASNGETIGYTNLSNAYALFGSTSTGIGIDNNEIVKKGGTFHITTGDSNSLCFNTNSAPRMTINSIGYVGIGTTEPSADLEVAGDILADEIRVEDIAANNIELNGNLAANNITVKTNGNTADFVFADDYDLKNLDEVEAFIKENSHLPEVPSAEEMEETGVNLAEMNKLLLQKVEELTLYAIEQKEEVERLKVEREKEKGERESLEERLVKIEVLLMQK